MEEPFQMRDLLNPELVKQISYDLKKAWPAFQAEGFQKALIPTISELGLKERAVFITDQLYEFLPKEYPKAARIMIDSFGAELGDPDQEAVASFYYMPHSHYVAKHGQAPEYFEISMKALYEITKRFTSEWAIRSFLVNYPDRTMDRLAEWVADPNPHVRRLVSEGTRPRLPWAERLYDFQKDPTPVLPLLEQLNRDPSLYVRRSVANHLNDIGKDHPDLVVEVLEQWNKIDDKGTKWLIRHALRSLIKKGHPGALGILGFPPDVDLEIKDFHLQPDPLVFGNKLEFGFTILSKEKKPCKLVIDYVLHFMKANGKLAPKVFKLSQKEIAPGETIRITKSHPIRPISTRKYYPGEQQLELQINGKSFGSRSFNLKM